jgi:hypothetical protein
MIKTVRQAWRIHLAVKKTLREATHLGEVTEPDEMVMKLEKAQRTIHACADYLAKQPRSIRFCLTLIAMGYKVKAFRMPDWAIAALLASLATIKIAYDYGHFRF